MLNKFLYIKIIGCQMNVYDSEQIVIRLSVLGYRQTATLQKADLVIVNTCSIRAKAEQKAFSFLGRLAGLKRKKPGLIIGIGGCVAQYPC
jgi:tRNA-2-methylthio-N6-dimethylallyladenosine synthase